MTDEGPTRLVHVLEIREVVYLSTGKPGDPWTPADVIDRIEGLVVDQQVIEEKPTDAS